MQDEEPSQDDELSQAEDPLRHNETLPGLIQQYLATQRLYLLCTVV